MKRAWFIMLIWISFAISGLTFSKSTAQNPTDPNWIRALVWNSDGSQIAIATQKGAIQILDTSGKSLRTLQSSGLGVYALSWNPEGTELASGGEDYKVTIWDVATGKTLHTFASHANAVLSIAWSPDGTRLLNTIVEDNVYLWDTTKNSLLRTIPIAEALSVAWNNTGSQFATGGLGSIEIWDSSTGKRIKQIKESQYAWALAWSPDGTKLANTSSYAPNKSTINIWDVDTGKLLKALEGHTDAALSVAWSLDGTQLVSTGDDQTIRIWDVKTGQTIKTIQAGSNVYRAVWSPFGGRLVYGEIADEKSISTSAPSNNVVSGIKFIVPFPSADELQAITKRCAKPEVQQSLTAKLDAKQLPAFTSAVKALTSDQIPPACAADLIAVAEALQKAP